MVQTKCRRRKPNSSPNRRASLNCPAGFHYPAAMTNPTDLKIAKWPFIAGDAILLVFALFLAWHSGGGMGRTEAMLFVACGIVGGGLAGAPFVLEYLAAVKMVETGAVVSTVNQLQNLDAVIAQIANATAQWQGI